MAKFYALQVIMGKIKFAQVPEKQKADALTIIEERGFMINDDGECAPAPIKEGE